MIKVPYNFVPFNKQVVTPHWINQISHDIPFQDSLSGSLEITITADSPIFIGGGTSHNSIQLFSQFDNRYFIPGSSIKGMIRSVLEILSFGSMHDRVNKYKYAFRDFNMQEDYLNKFKPTDIYCGWLVKNLENESYSVIDCGKPGRISHEELSQKASENISTYYQIKGRFNPEIDKEKSAFRKYELFGIDKSLDYSFSHSKTNAGREIYDFNETGKKGTLVFTGQAGPRKKNNEKWTGHHLEFVFFENGKTIKVSNEVIENFLFAYFDHDRAKWSVDWKRRREELFNGKRIPIFYLKDEKEEISAIGLSYLFKLPFKNSVTDLLIKHLDKKDLSDAIFGYTNSSDSLKGRVHIGHAFATHAEESEKPVTAVLSTPKASYYPTYIRQNSNKNGKVSQYTTYMDDKAEISGWKRYPLHRELKSNLPKDPKNADILTRFNPLKAGAVFECSIKYHNLRPIELGSLISALTFHGSNQTKHNLGMGKPLGYGKISVQLNNMEFEQQKKYLSLFEAYMNVELGHKTPKWHASDQVRELLTMAKEQGADESLSYMDLDTHREIKAKSKKLSLQKYSNLDTVEPSIATNLCDEKAIEGQKILIENEKIMFPRHNLETLIKSKIQTTQIDLQSKLEAKKSDLLNELNKRLEAKKQAEAAEIEVREKAFRAEQKNQKAAKAKEKGPDWESIDATSKNAFDMLKKEIEKWGRDALKQNNIKKLLEQFPNGFLPVDYHEDLSRILESICNNLSKKDKQKWQKPYEQNAVLKKIGEWIGEEKAKRFTCK